MEASQPLLIGEHFRILPPGCQKPSDARHNLVISRGAFGSGEHETTASCLDLLATMIPVQGAQALDFGSGTGILALAALKLGAHQAVCVDISPEAIATCQRNAALNGMSERIRCVTGSMAQLGETGFDLVLANIYGDLLLDFAGELVRATRPGGLLLLSGILWEYNFEVRQAYEKLGCELLRHRMLEEFSTLLLRRATSEACGH